MVLTNFESKVISLLKKIPRGKVSTYKYLARAASRPKASRAVGNACGKNPYAPKVPCHRVINSNGRLGGYAHGAKRKIALLKKEGIIVVSGKVKDFKSRLYKF